MTAPQPAYSILRMNSPFDRKAIRTFPTYADAVAHAQVHYQIVVFSEDRENDAADFLTTAGDIFMIEPIKAH